MAINIENKNSKIYIGSAKVLRAYLGGTKIYSSGNTVTYYTDTGTAYTEEAEEGASCLSPKTFTPAKSGWEFVGWRQDKTASDSVLSSLSMGDTPVTLYAVFRQTVTVTYYNNSTSASSTSGYRYYNNGNVVNPSFTLTQAALSGWSARGWSTSTAANGGITYSNGSAFTRDSNITLYGMYQKTITLSYNGNGHSSGSTAAQTGTRYHSSSGIADVNPSFTLRANGFTRTGYAFTKWAYNGTGGTQYAAGASIAVTANTTMYAVWIAAKLTVFQKSDADSTPSIYNTNYVSTTLGVGTVGRIAEWVDVYGHNTPMSGTVTIKASGTYTKATVTIAYFSNYANGKIKKFINGVSQGEVSFAWQYAAPSPQSISLKSGDTLTIQTAMEPLNNGSTIGAWISSIVLET